MNVTIVGATGSLGRAATSVLLDETDAFLTLFSRTANQLPNDSRVTTIAASVFDKVKLEKAIAGSDVVFVALSGDLPKMVAAVVEAMQATQAKRIIFISSYGIYGELPNQNGQVAPILSPYRQAVDFLEQTELDYTILRPGWFDNSSDWSYTLYSKGEVIYGNNISRFAIADFVKEVVLDSTKFIRENLGIVRD